MEYSKTWKGLLRDGEYEVRYSGKSTEVMKQLIETLQFHLANLEAGIIGE